MIIAINPLGAAMSALQTAVVLTKAWHCFKAFCFKDRLVLNQSLKYVGTILFV